MMKKLMVLLCVLAWTSDVVSAADRRKVSREQPLLRADFVQAHSQVCQLIDGWVKPVAGFLEVGTLIAFLRETLDDTTFNVLMTGGAIYFLYAYARGRAQQEQDALLE